MIFEVNLQDLQSLCHSKSIYGEMAKNTKHANPLSIVKLTNSKNGVTNLKNKPLKKYPLV